MKSKTYSLSTGSGDELGQCRRLGAEESGDTSGERDKWRGVLPPDATVVRQHNERGWPEQPGNFDW